MYLARLPSALRKSLPLCNALMVSHYDRDQLGILLRGGYIRAIKRMKLPTFISERDLVQIWHEWAPETALYFARHHDYSISLYNYVSEFGDDRVAELVVKRQVLSTQHHGSVTLSALSNRHFSTAMILMRRANSHDKDIKLIVARFGTAPMIAMFSRLNEDRGIVHAMIEAAVQGSNIDTLEGIIKICAFSHRRAKKVVEAYGSYQFKQTWNAYIDGLCNGGRYDLAASGILLGNGN